MMPPTKPSPTEAQQKQVRQEALDMLIDDVLVRQYLSQHMPKVTQAEFTKELDALKASLKTRGINFQDFLRDTHQDESHLRLDIVKKLQWESYVNHHATEEALKKYYEQNRDFYDRVTVQASHILFRLPPTASDSEKAEARAKLLALRQQIMTGQIDFAEAAKKYSQCQTAASGGDIGSFLRKWVVDDRIATAAFALKVGEVSDVVETDLGLHLIKVTGRKPGQPSKFDAIKAEVRENFAMELWHDLLVQQRKIAKIEIK
jgi:parvulin-like peptidyl-prolyl isomerase